jgi:hypothetical protein
MRVGILTRPRRLVERLEWHYTPKHGIWLDLAESELGVLASQCLERRIADKQTLVEEIAAWEADRNANTPTLTGNFQQPMHASNSSTCTCNLNESSNWSRAHRGAFLSRIDAAHAAHGDYPCAFDRPVDAQSKRWRRDERCYQHGGAWIARFSDPN